MRDLDIVSNKAFNDIHSQIEDELKKHIAIDEIDRVSKRVHPDGSEIFYLDDEPIFKLGPVEFKQHSDGESVTMEIYCTIKRYA